MRVEPRAFAVVGPERRDLSLPDGVSLAADVYRPDAPGRFPALVMRQPYGRRIASTVVLAHPSWYASHGYVVIVQDVRGRGDSGGAFRVLADDPDDGAATLAWAADHPACDGKVATYGFSYQAMTQFMALAGALRAGTKLPDAIAPAMGAWSVRDDWAYDGGCFRLAGGLGWAVQMAVEQARIAGDRDAFSALATAAGDIAAGRLSARPQFLPLLDRYAPHYRAWLDDDRATFTASSPCNALAGALLKVPGLFIGGWFDFLLSGTLAAHHAFTAAAAAPQRLLIGPWPHIPWSRRSGGVDFGPDSCSDVDREAIRFFDHHLKGVDEAGPPVMLFDLGAKRWFAARTPVADDVLTLHLASTGRAATTSTDGVLALDGPGVGQDHLVHDPWRPAPLIGGHNGQPSGLQDRAALDDRTDVAVYSSLPLPRDIRLLGSVACDLHVESSMPSHDLHCTLSMLDEFGGRAVTLATGHLRVQDATITGPRRIALQPVCATLAKGSRLRFSIQAAAWPAFPVNPGSGQRAEESGSFDACVTTLVIRNAGSRIGLPIST